MTESNTVTDTKQNPEDIATLYSWANMRGAKYRDFSGSRQEMRAQSRYRMLVEQEAAAQKALPGSPFSQAELRAEQLGQLPEIEPWAQSSLPSPETFSDIFSTPADQLDWPPLENDALPRRASGHESLQQSQERVASRWFALSGVFESAAEKREPAKVQALARQTDARTPAVAMFSLAGGVGKTSMAATLGRALAARGERVLLADTTSYGLLPFYFGARELRPGVVRTFSGAASDAPIQVVNLEVSSLDMERNGAARLPVPSIEDTVDTDPILEGLQRSAHGANRLLIDIATGSAALTRRLLRLAPIVIVPIVPDMNSVVTLQAVDAFFRGQPDEAGRPLQPFYLLNQFDASVPLHLDVREVLRRQLGDRLLPFVVRRSQAINEALAEGMTVIDYAPNSPISEDYLNLAGWIRSISAPSSMTYRGARWSEQ